MRRHAGVSVRLSLRVGNRITCASIPPITLHKRIAHQEQANRGTPAVVASLPMRRNACVSVGLSFRARNLITCALRTSNIIQERIVHQGKKTKEALQLLHQHPCEAMHAYLLVARFVDEIVIYVHPYLR
jgi:hypothetical protein